MRNLIALWGVKRTCKTLKWYDVPLEIFRCNSLKSQLAERTRWINSKFQRKRASIDPLECVNANNKGKAQCSGSTGSLIRGTAIAAFSRENQQGLRATLVTRVYVRSSSSINDKTLLQDYTLRGLMVGYIRPSMESEFSSSATSRDVHVLTKSSSLRSIHWLRSDPWDSCVATIGNSLETSGRCIHLSQMHKTTIAIDERKQASSLKQQRGTFYWCSMFLGDVDSCCTASRCMLSRVSISSKRCCLLPILVGSVTMKGENETRNSTWRQKQMFLLYIFVTGSKYRFKIDLERTVTAEKKQNVPRYCFGKEQLNYY